MHAAVLALLGRTSELARHAARSRERVRYPDEEHFPDLALGMRPGNVRITVRNHREFRLDGNALPRSVQRNCQHEPAYLGAPTVLFSIRSPDLCAHRATAKCMHEHPHEIADCGEFQ